MDLQEIVKQQAKFVDNYQVLVDVNSSMSWVNIYEHKTNLVSGDEPYIFLQGDEADNFIKQVDDLWMQYPDLDRETVIKSVAYPYLDLLVEVNIMFDCYGNKQVYLVKPSKVDYAVPNHGQIDRVFNEVTFRTYRTMAEQGGTGFSVQLHQENAERLAKLNGLVLIDEDKLEELLND